MIIINEPKDEWEYEFIVAEKTLNPEIFFFVGRYKCYTNDVEKLLTSNPNYVIIHNVRVSNKQKRGK